MSCVRVIVRLLLSQKQLELKFEILVKFWATLICLNQIKFKQLKTPECPITYHIHTHKHIINLTLILHVLH